MSSPDFSQYVDLTVYDQQPNAIYNAALDYMRLTLPEFELVPGSIEDVILQGVAQMTGYTSAAINRLPNSVSEVLLKLFDIQRLSGTATTGTITITFVDGIAHTVPAGTRFGYTVTENEQATLYIFNTTESVTGTTSVSVGIEGESLSVYPQLLDGANLRLLTSISFIDSAVLDGDLSVGGGSESDADYFARAIAKLASYTTALTTANQFQAYVLTTYAGVQRAKAYSRLNPANLTIASGAGEADGWLTVFACGLGGSALDGGLVTTIEDALVDRAVAGLNISVESPAIETVTFSTTITLETGAIAGDVEDAVQAAIDSYIHPDYWMWEPTIYYNNLVGIVYNVVGVANVQLLEINGDVLDVDLADYGMLPEVDWNDPASGISIA